MRRAKMYTLRRWASSGEDSAAVRITIEPSGFGSTGTGRPPLFRHSVPATERTLSRMISDSSLLSGMRQSKLLSGLTRSGSMCSGLMLSGVATAEAKPLETCEA